MENRRRLKRQHLIYYLKLFDLGSNQLSGHLVDITTGGCMMISKESCEVKRIYEMRLALPNEIFGKKEIRFQAQAVWCGADINPDYQATGFLFVDISQQDMAIIDQIITRFGFQD